MAAMRRIVCQLSLVLLVCLSLAVCGGQRVQVELPAAVPSSPPVSSFLSSLTASLQQLSVDAVSAAQTGWQQEQTAAVLSSSVTTAVGLCRGQSLPGSLRYCLRPGDAADVSVTIVNSGAAHWTPATASSIALSVTVNGPHPVSVSPSSLLPAGTGGRGEAALQAGGSLQLRGVLQLWSRPPRVGLFELSFSSPASSAVRVNTTGLSLSLELTCSDGVFCNGAEQLVGDACSSGPPACDDGDECTADSCDEAFGLCFHRLLNGSAAAAAHCPADEQEYCSGPRCLPSCPPEAQCGPDGCGGVCGGGCSAPHTACAAHRCVAAAYPFSCLQPQPLLAAHERLLGRHERIFDLQAIGALDETHPACSQFGTEPDVVLAFTVPESLSAGAGVDVWLRGEQDAELDTLLEVRRERCSDRPLRQDELGQEQGDDFVCSDNSEPPAGNSARLTARLPPGRYFLLLSTLPVYRPTAGPSPLAFSLFPSALPASRSSQLLRLSVYVVDGYVPDCRSKQCGDDGRQADGCGVCPPLSRCNASSFQCQADHCVPQCAASRGCGDDGCGGGCGGCESGWGCARDLQLPYSRCIEDPISCDGRQPVCDAGCAAEEYCGADCLCHSLSAPMPDLVVKLSDLVAELSVAAFNFSSRSCSLVEGCIAAAGRRRILRFSVSVLNQGLADVRLPDPRLHPLSFHFSPCHQHFHYDHFAQYSLSRNGSVAVQGHKQAFCLEDTRQEIVGRHVACLPRFNCTSPGIQRGWSDRSSSSSQHSCTLPLTVRCCLSALPQERLLRRRP